MTSVRNTEWLRAADWQVPPSPSTEETFVGGTEKGMLTLK